MRGNFKLKQAYCERCHRMTSYTKNAIVYGCGDLVMVLCTFGLWLVVKFVFDAWINPWRCTECGGKL